MPIHVTDYTWHQTEKKVLLALDLHHTSPKNVDIVTTDLYLKVSFLPYIFEAFLCHVIDADKSTARILSDRIEIDLVKETHEHWNDLCLELSQEEMQLRRQDAIQALQKQEEKKLKKNKEERIHRERFSIGQQITEDNRLREERSRKMDLDKIEFFQNSAEKNSSDSQETAVSIRSRLSSTCSEDGLGVASEVDYDGDGEDSHYYSSTENLLLMNGKTFVEKVEIGSKKQQRKCSAARKGAGKDGKKNNAKENKKEEKKKSPSLPPVRQSGTIVVKHTPRAFPTPSRESRKQEEDEWLASQSIISESKELNGASEGIDFYKEKAQSLFENGDYKGCVNAYSEALKLNPKLASIYSNRAAANLALNNLHRAVSDCSKALELLAPPTEDNSKSRLLVHIRRGTSFVRLGLYSEGLLDYRAALKLSPEDTNLSHDIQKIQAIMMASTDSGDSNESETDSDDQG